MANGGAEGTVEEAVRLVLGVARLGEADLRGWWNCHGLDKEGSFVLKRAFPRTWQPAALELDVLSAAAKMTLGFEECPNGTVCQVDVVAGNSPVFARRNKGEADLYVRLNNSIRILNTADALEYVQTRGQT